MWPVALPHLPDHVRAQEDEDFLLLNCARCGQQVAWFSAKDADPVQIEVEAWRHDCG